jgi:hypothetical protein
MPLLRAVADKLSNNDLVAGVITEIIDRDELFALVPFLRTNGKAYVYNREHASNAANDTSAFIASGGVVPESSADFTTVTTLLKILIGDVDVDKFSMEVESDTNNQLAIQIALKAKYIARQFRNKLVNGDSSVVSDEFDGLKRLVTVTGNEFAAATNGAALSLDLLDQLIDMVPNGPDALMMHGRTIRKLRQLLRAVNGNDAAMIEIPNFGVPVLAFNGTPIIRNDFIATNEVEGTSGAVCSSIYALRLNEADGFHGLYGGDAAGLRIEDVGTVQNKDATRTRLKWYCGAALKSTRSLARLKGINAS